MCRPCHPGRGMHERHRGHAPPRALVHQEWLYAVLPRVGGRGMHMEMNAPSSILLTGCSALSSLVGGHTSMTGAISRPAAELSGIPGRRGCYPCQSRIQSGLYRSSDAMAHGTLPQMILTFAGGRRPWRRCGCERCHYAQQLHAGGLRAHGDEWTHGWIRPFQADYFHVLRCIS